VFYDQDSIRPGAKWQNEIDDAIRSVRLLVVFWCTHSQGSEEVGREIGVALSSDKDVLPVLLDSTPLSEPLAEFQWIDFQGMVGRVHASSMDGNSQEECALEGVLGGVERPDTITNTKIDATDRVSHPVRLGRSFKFGKKIPHSDRYTEMASDLEKAIRSRMN
jgi:hypothetical protein